MTAKLLSGLVLILALTGCEMPVGRADGEAIAGFDGRSANAVTITAPVQWTNNDGEIMIAIDGTAVPVYTGYFRQPVGPGEVVTVQGWQEPGGRNRILAQSVVTSDGRQVFP